MQNPLLRQKVLDVELERQKAQDLHHLLAFLHEYRRQQPSLSDIETIHIIQQYLTDHNRDLETAVTNCSISKVNTLQSVSDEMDRMRYVIHQLNHHIFDDPSIPDKDSNYLDDDDISMPQSPASRQSENRSVSPFSLPSPSGEIEFKPLDLDDVPVPFKPRRYSQIPPSYRGEYKIDIITQGIQSILIHH